MHINKYLDVKPEVAEAIAQGKPVVALESTIISHGMPYPQNVETALQVEKIIRPLPRPPAGIWRCCAPGARTALPPSPPP